MKARITVTLKTGILDPQGKVFDIELPGADKTKAEATLKDAADKLLANTVIENYRVEVLG
ncbi:MAG TPA: phosphoribosylformylglycinamidine synthase subunit PurS [Nitrobacter sp.]|nr:phosphoribosylformylglycinamidine synthase subunit PurS [Nitrobacter sp.]